MSCPGMEQAAKNDGGDGSLACGLMEDVAVGDLDLMEELFMAAPGFDFSDFSQPGPAAASPGPCFSPLFDMCSTVTTANAPADGDTAERLDRPPAWVFQPAPEVEATVKDRLRRALERIASLSQTRPGEMLAQVWVPMVIGDRQVLTTCGQPFWMDCRNERLASYRTVSMKYQFSADETARAGLGLPGRVFVGRVPEWTPDVRYFSTEEYPRVSHARYFDIRGSVALPIFEPRTRACLGVVELVMTTEKINYNAEIENICSALKEVDLRSSVVSSDPRAKVAADTSYREVVPEIMDVLRTVCETHELPLAQTWIPCICQAKRGSRHTDEKIKYCVSTVDEACYVRDLNVKGFHEACSEHHLFRGEGAVGRAFGTNEPCFSPNVASYSKVQYPLSHHAKLFSLRAAVAIRLRSTRTGSLDYVLEFFLPVDCVESEEQRAMLNSLSTTIQQTCYTLRVVSLKELVDEGSFQTSALTPPEYTKTMHENLDEVCSGIGVPARATLPETSEEESSWVASLVCAQNKGVKEMDGDLPFGFSKQEDEGFSVTPGWHTSSVLRPEAEGGIFSGFKNEEYEVKEVTCPRDPSSSNLEKTVERRRTKMEKTVNLEELRKHFAGSLKEAAKNLGVCPTTLKRICRQHGINRWPSRKIKKVGHSLKKLQMVIDSVHGGEGTVQLSSLYENFTKTTWSERVLEGDSTYPLSERKGHLEPLVPDQQCEGRFTSHTSGSNSLSPSCSQSSNSSHGCSSGSKAQQCGSAPHLAVKQEVYMEENQSSTLLKAASHVELQMFAEERLVTPPGSQSQMLSSEQKPVENAAGMQKSKPDSLKIKAMYGEERCIFRLQPSWGFEKLKEEILKRFSIAQEMYVDLKYLDDESEWVLLTCDADLLECIDVYKSSSAQTVRILVNSSGQPVLGPSFGQTVLS
ncbi:hypothetical protein BS78_01G493200 [Paspalum vaginatum]|nr:hypothetical protein BS78_01G493200 [Paspalum vaginatum]